MTSDERAGAGTPRTTRTVALLRLVHPFPSLLVTLVTLALIPLADRDASPAIYAQLGLGMLAYQFAIGAANDVADADLDARTKPSKPVGAGLLSRRFGARFAAICAGAGMLVTAGLDLGPWFIGVAGLLCGLAYDLRLKRTALSWLPWAVAFPLIPVWVWSATAGWSAMLAWVFPIGFLLGLSVYLVNQSPDAASDRSAAVRGLAQRLGGRRAAGAGIGLFGVAASACVLVLLATGFPGRALLAAVSAALALVLSVRAAVLFGRDGLFGVVATTSAVLAVVFLSAV
jgi:4-hydroxybenzoate polyprenyltransferase